MKVFAQNSVRPSQVLFAFDEVADATVIKVRWAVAYSTRRGCDRLVRHISSRMGQGRWANSEKHFVTSLDFGLTEPAALEYLAGLPESTVDIANPEVINKPGLMPGTAPRWTPKTGH